MMFDDDRPIKPDQKYLQQKDQKIKEQKSKQRQYLQKNKQSVLPCHKENIQNGKQRSQSPKSKSRIKSKAKIYEQIKKINRQKFGEWDKNKKKDNNNFERDKIKRIKTSQITVNYRPKVANIDTRQYKKPDYKEEKKFITKKSLQEEKKQYQKMLEYMKKVFNLFEIQKQAFDKERQYLKFRKTIEKQPGIVIETKPQKLKSKVNSNVMLNTRSQNNIKNIMASSEIKPNIGESKQISKNSPRQNQQQQNDDTTINKFQYSIEKLYECHPFNLKQIYNYANKSQFISQNCQLYQKAKNVIQINRATAKVQTIKPKCTHGSIGSNHVACSEQECAQKRISKFPQGWYELWVAGRYRTVYNKQLNYKVVWYNNEDIKQQFSNGRVQTYDCKAKKVIEIKVDKQPPFWYFPYINQLQSKDAKENTQIIFSDGRHQIIVNPQNL